MFTLVKNLGKKGPFKYDLFIDGIKCMAISRMTIFFLSSSPVFVFLLAVVVFIVNKIPIC